MLMPTLSVSVIGLAGALVAMTVGRHRLGPAVGRGCWERGSASSPVRSPVCSWTWWLPPVPWRWEVLTGWLL